MLMRIIKVKANAEHGSIVLEAALIVPVIMVICYFMLSASLTVQHEVIMRYALDNTAKELSVLFPFAEALYQDHLSGFVDENIPILEEVPKSLQEDLLNISSSVLLQDFIQNKVEKWLIIGANQLKVKIPSDQRKISISTSGDYALRLKMDYHIKTPWTEKERVIYSYIPLWTKYDSDFISVKDESVSDGKEADGIWEEHNFVRGKYFRDKFDANLPFNYPVISGFKNGQAIGIRSIDLTAPQYQNNEILQRQFEKEMTDLSNFRGGNKPTNINPSVISEEDIISRRLIIVVPKNGINEKNKIILDNVKNIAKNNNVILQLETIGNSYRYIEQKDNE